MRRLLRVLIAGTTALVLNLAAPGAWATEAIVIGRTLALSGPLRIYGEAKRDGGDALVASINAAGGIGVALLPEPIVSAAEHIIHLVYPSPRGMRPSVRSLIDYLMIHLPAGIQERSV